MVENKKVYAKDPAWISVVRNSTGKKIVKVASSDVKTPEDLEIERRMIAQHPDWLKYIRDPSDELRRIAAEASLKLGIARIEKDIER